MKVYVATVRLIMDGDVPFFEGSRTVGVYEHLDTARKALETDYNSFKEDENDSGEWVFSDLFAHRPEYRYSYKWEIKEWEVK